MSYSYPTVPEKYLPNVQTDTVGYFEDGAYDYVIGSFNDLKESTQSDEMLESQYNLAATDSERDEVPIRGVRRVRCIRALVDVDINDMNYGNPRINYQVFLAVRREGVQLVPSNVLDQIFVFEKIPQSQPSNISTTHSFQLEFPGVVDLYSGDYISIIVVTSGPGTYTRDVSFNIKYFIKFA